MSEQSATRVQWFRPNGRGLGIFLLVLWVVIAGFCLAYRADRVVLGLLVLCAVMTHLVLLRPRIGTTGEDLVYRQMLTDLAIPLTAVETVRVTRYFQVSVAGRSYVSPALGRSRRATSAARRRDPHAAGRQDPLSVYVDLVEDTVRARVADARSRLRADAAPREIRRTWARLELIETIAAIILFLVIVAS
jgi:hypothetical protein